MSQVPWRPTIIRRFIRAFPTSACTALVDTDAGLGYLKAMGGPEGPHTLAAELVGTQLAGLLGLSTLDYAIIAVDDVDEIPFIDRPGHRVGQAIPGPAYITRRERGDTWGGDKLQLSRLANPADISRLVVFDTWTLNCDRHCLPEAGKVGKARVNRNNVFLSEEAPRGKLLLKAIDHTHCFTCGREWTPRLSRVDTMKDGRVFGRFAEFEAFLDRTAVAKAIAQLQRVGRTEVADILNSIPREWEVTRKASDALLDLIVGRAAYVAQTIEDRLWPQKGLLFPTDPHSEPRT